MFFNKSAKFSMAKYSYVIFDFDGTVVDTGEGIFKSLVYSFEQMNHEVPDLKDLRRFIGPPIHYSYTTFYGISEDEVGEYIKKYRERYAIKGIIECELYKGMTELLDSLKKEGIKIGVASSKPEHLIYKVCDHLGITDWFDAIVGVKVDDSTHSTKTHLVLESMEKLGADDKDKVLMVGDRYFDIDGGKGAGVSSCGVLWGYGSKEEFTQHNADYIVKSPSDVLKIAL